MPAGDTGVTRLHMFPRVTARSENSNLMAQKAREVCRGRKARCTHTGEHSCVPVCPCKSGLTYPIEFKKGDGAVTQRRSYGEVQYA